MIASRLATIGINYKLGGYCDEALAIFNRLTGEQPSNPLKELINEVIEGLKTDGVFALRDCLYVRGVHAAEMACQNWIKNAHNSTLVNSPTFIAKQGFRGNGTSSYINNNYKPATDAITFQLKSGEVTFMCKELPTIASRILGTMEGDATLALHVRYYTTPYIRGYILSNTYNQEVTIDGDYVNFRKEDGFLRCFVNKIYKDSAVVTDVNLCTRDMAELAMKYGNGATAYSDALISYSSYGGILGIGEDPGLLEKEYDWIKYFYDNVGGTF